MEKPQNTGERRLEEIVNRSPAVAYLARNARGWPVEFVSENVRQFGYDAEEFRSGRMVFADALHPLDAERIGAEVETFLREGRDEFVQEYRVLTKSGDLRWVESRVWVQKDARGAATHFQGILLDVTEQKRTRRALATLSQCNQALVRASNELEFVREVCRIAVETGGYRMAWVGVPEADAQKSVRPVAWWGNEDRYLREEFASWADVPAGRGPVGRAIRSRKPDVAQRISRDPKFRPWRDAALRRGYGSVASLPLVEGEEVLGVLSIYAADPDAFDTGELDLLTDLSRDLAYGIRTLRMRREQEKAEETLREAEAKYRSLVEQNLDGIYIVQNDRFVFANRQFLDMLGYTWDELGKILANDVLTARSLEQVLERDRRRRAGEAVPEQYEFQVVRKDGAPVDVEARVRKIVYEGRQAYQGCLRDITHRKRAEKEILALNATLEARVRRRTFDLQVLYDLIQEIGYALDYEVLFHALLEHIHRAVSFDVAAGILVTDTQQKVFIHPRRPLTMTAQGAVREHLLEAFAILGGQDVTQGRLHVRVQEPTEAEAGSPPIDHLASYFQVPIVVGEKTVGVLLVGAERPKAFDEDQIHMLNMVASHASRSIQRIRELLDAEYGRLDRLFKSLPEGVCLLDPDRRVVLANPVAKEYLLALSDAGVGDAISSVGGCALEDLLAPGAEGKKFEAVLRVPRERIFEVAAYEVAEARGAEGSWLLVIREVTKERQLQEGVEQQYRLASVGQLAAGIAHDFNNLLTVIIGFAQMLELRGDVPEHAKEDLRSIFTQGQRAAQLIRQILDFSRKTVVSHHPLDLVPFVKEAMKLFTRTLPETIHLTVEVEADSLMVSGNLTQLQQVVTNLMVNARDAMPDGGGLRVELSNFTVETEVESPLPGIGTGPWALLTVSDTGVGMSQEVIRHIFEPFFTTKRKGEGTGLGLAQVYGIVKQHGGEIGVESEPGRGTVFRIYLPIIQEEELSEPGEPSHLQKGNGEYVLVVEDNPSVLQTTKTMLDMLDYQVFEASNGQEALEVYDTHRAQIGLVLTDMVMPGMGGLELCGMLRERDPALRVVVMTGYPVGTEEALRTARGTVQFLEKPVALERLGRELRQAFQEKE